MLVSTERASQGLNRELDTMRAVEESLRERIATLETELSLSNSQSRSVKPQLSSNSRADKRI